MSKKIESLTIDNGIKHNNFAVFSDNEGAYELFDLAEDTVEYVPADELLSTIRNIQTDLRKWSKFNWS